jgi:hypothetical protein
MAWRQRMDAHPSVQRALAEEAELATAHHATIDA